MAESSDRHERTEPATAKRLEEARKRGQIPRSRDFSAAAVMIAAGAALYTMGQPLGMRLAGLMRANLSLTREQSLDSAQLVPILSNAALEALLAASPVLACTLVAALVAPLALGGWAFSSEALVPKFSRLDPIAGMGRLFALRGWVELIKSLAKFAFVGTAGAIVLWKNVDALQGLGREPMGQAIGHACTLSGQALIVLACALIGIAAVDVPFQLWQYRRDLKMTREEVRREHKESEGNPEVKAQIRSLQRERARQRMMLDVPKADVIIVNPTHFAVALRYDDKRMRAPIVVAKGADLIAAKIREVAGEHNIPIFKAPPLARALYRSVEIGGEIPAKLYVAVAQVLTYIFQVRTARKEHATPPPAPSIHVDEQGFDEPAVDPDPQG